MKDGISWYLMGRGGLMCGKTAEFFCVKSSQRFCVLMETFDQNMAPGAAKRSERGERVPWGANSINVSWTVWSRTCWHLLWCHLVRFGFTGQLEAKTCLCTTGEVDASEVQGQGVSWVGEWRLMDDVCEDVTQKPRLPSTTVYHCRRSFICTPESSCWNEFCLIGFILFIVLRNYR